MSATLNASRVLIVDDERIGRESLRTLLCSYDQSISCEVAASGADALSLAREFQPDLVIVDWLLGGPANGVELSRALRAEHPATPLVVVSGHTGIDLEELSDDDRVWLLQKPFQLRELLEIVNS